MMRSTAKQLFFPVPGQNRKIEEIDLAVTQRMWRHITFRVPVGRIRLGKPARGKSRQIEKIDRARYDRGEIAIFAPGQFRPAADMPLLVKAGFGVAMTTAPVELKAKADLTTADVAAVLRKLL